MLTTPFSSGTDIANVVRLPPYGSSWVLVSLFAKLNHLSDITILKS